MKAKKITSTPAKSLYKINILNFGRKYTATGDSVRGAISNLNLKNVKGRAVMTVEKEGFKKERILQPMQAMRLFNTNGVSRDVALKGVSSLFNGL